MSAVTSASLCWTLLPVCLLLVSAEQKNITAECGQNVTLTCRAPNNNTITGVEWSRADLEPEYLLVYRDGQFLQENQHPSFKNRVDLQDRQMKDGDVSVILKDVTVNDAGTYECHVVQRGTNRSMRGHVKTAPISIIYLRVVAPPGPSGGDTEDGEKEDGGKTDGRKEDGGKEDGGKVDGGKEDGRKEDGGKDHVFVCLQVFVVLIVVVSFVILIEYKHRRKLEKRAASY